MLLLVAMVVWCCWRWLCAAATLLLQGAYAASQKSSGRIDPDAAKATIGGKAKVSQCAKDCIEKARKVGFLQVANDTMACFVTLKGNKRMSTADCCDKVGIACGVAS